MVLTYKDNVNHFIKEQNNYLRIITYELEL